MIIALHGLLYSDDPAATRAFFRDVLERPFVEDAGTEPGWLIFQTGPSEIGVHPTRAEHGGEVFETPRSHNMSFVCDDVEATRADLEAKGVTFVAPIADRGWGLTTAFEVPGIDPVMLYQPKHPTAYDL